jgi:outer membrane protein OmpA-like peptidoglycan-associated protein
VKGRIYDSDDKKKKNPLLTAVVQITCDSADKDAMRYDTTFSRNKATYMFNLARNQSYKMHVTKDGYYANSATCSVKGLDESDTMTVDIFIEKIKPKSVRIEGIYYAYDRAELQAESEPALKQLLGILNDNPVIKVEISSHTDNRGNDAYNMKLSQARAESVVKYLITNGIDKQRLVAKGYGETHPDTINQNPDGSDCPTCRARNRRTEFKIIGQIANTTIIYDQAAPITVDSATTTQEVEAREKEGKGANFIGNPNNKPAANTTAPAGGTTTPAKVTPKTTAKEDSEEASSDDSSDSSDDSAATKSDEEETSSSKSKSTGSKTKPTTTTTKASSSKSSSASKKKGSVEED